MTIDFAEAAPRVRRKRKAQAAPAADYSTLRSLVEQQSRELRGEERKDVSLNAEEGISYALMHDPATYSYIAEHVDMRNFFYYDRTRKLLDATMDLAVESGEVERLDISRLPDILARKGYLGSGEDQVSEQYVMAVYGADTYNPAYVKQYMNTLKRLAAFRKALIAFQTGILSLSDMRSDPLDVKAQVETDLYEMEKLMTGVGMLSGYFAFNDEQFKLNSEAQRLKEESRKARPLPVSGIRVVDGNPNGYSLDDIPLLVFFYSKLITILSRTGGFKSATAMQIALMSAILNGVNVLYGTTELGVDEIRLRMVSFLSRIPCGKLEDWLAGVGRISKEEQEAYEAHSAALAGESVMFRGKDISIPGRINFYDSGTKGADVYAKEILARTRSMVRDPIYHKRGFGLIILDQIQDMGASRTIRADKTSDIISENMRIMKDVATSLDTPVLVVSHINDAKCKTDDDWGIIPDEYSALDSREPVRKAQYALGLAPNASGTRMRIELIKGGTRKKGEVRYAEVDPTCFRIR